MEREIRKQNYRNAYNCRKCPATDGEDGCPNWWRWQETDNLGRTKIVEQCGDAAAKGFELQRLGNTRFVVDNVVATRNIIDKTAQRLVEFVHSGQFTLEDAGNSPAIGTQQALPNESGEMQ